MKNSLIAAVVVVFFAFSPLMSQGLQPGLPITSEYSMLQIGQWGKSSFSGLVQMSKFTLMRTSENSFSVTPPTSQSFQVSKEKSAIALLPGMEFRVVRAGGKSQIAYSERFHWLQIKTDDTSMGHGSNVIMLTRANTMVFFPKMTSMENIAILFGYICAGAEVTEVEMEIIVPQKDHQNPAFLSLDLLTFLNQKRQQDLVAWTVSLATEMIAGEFTTATARIDMVTCATDNSVLMVNDDGKTKIVVRKNNKIIKEIPVEEDRPWMVRITPTKTGQGAIQRKDKDA